MTERDRPLLERLQRVDAASLCDANKSLRVLSSAIRPVAPGARLLGRAVTAAAHGDLMSVLAALHSGTPGDVLVVSTDECPYAVAGELFATEAIRRGMAGIVIDGLCRDTATLARLPLPFYARGATPRAAPAQAVPDIQVPILVGGVEVRPGELLVGDDDGIVVAAEGELESAIDAAEAIQVSEEALRSSMGDGVSLFERLNFAEHNARIQEGRDSRLSFETE